MIAGEKWWKVVATRWVRCWLGYLSPPLPTVCQTLACLDCLRKKDPLLSCTDDGGKINQTGDRDPVNRNSHCLVVPCLTWPSSPLLKRCVGVQRVWLTSSVAGCFDCCCTFLSLIMTYPSRVCLANSFLFSNRSSSTRRRSGGPQQWIMRVPHHQNLLPFYLNRHARWRPLPT